MCHTHHRPSRRRCARRSRSARRPRRSPSPGRADASAAGPFTLAYTPVDRLAQSTGNLYWTTHYLNEFGPSAATVYRASKSNSPGLEQALYTEYFNGWFYFGDLTYALTYDWYGYFVANYPSSGVSRIKRVPLTGGSAVTLVHLARLRRPARHRQPTARSCTGPTPGGLRKMSIGRRRVTTLVPRPSITSVALDAYARLLLATAQSIRAVATRPAAASRYDVDSSTVTTMHLHVGSGGTSAVLGQATPPSSASSAGSYITTYQGPISGRRAWSVSFDGSRVLWTDCTYPNGNGCAVRKRQSCGRRGRQRRRRGGNVQGDAGAMFWSDSLLKKYVH